MSPHFHIDGRGDIPARSGRVRSRADRQEAMASIATVGVPREIKTAEGRVSLTPDGVREFERLGIDVFVETGAGEGASISDADYVAAGADIVETNTFSSTSIAQADYKLESIVRELNTAAVACARRVSHSTAHCTVAASSCPSAPTVSRSPASTIGNAPNTKLSSGKAIFVRSC
jgi:hypothetical protein